MQQSLLVILLVIAGLITAASVGWFAATRRSQRSEEETDGYPHNFFQKIGLNIGIALGILGGLAIDNVPAGLVVGIGFGILLGQFLEKRRKGGTRPLTEEEKHARASRTSVGVVAIWVFLLATVVAAVLTLFK